LIGGVKDSAAAAPRLSPACGKEGGYHLPEAPPPPNPPPPLPLDPPPPLPLDPLPLPNPPPPDEWSERYLMTRRRNFGENTIISAKEMTTVGKRKDVGIRLDAAKGSRCRAVCRGCGG